MHGVLVLFYSLAIHTHVERVLRFGMGLHVWVHNYKIQIRVHNIQDPDSRAYILWLFLHTYKKASCRSDAGKLLLCSHGDKLLHLHTPSHAQFPRICLPSQPISSPWPPLHACLLHIIVLLFL